MTARTNLLLPLCALAVAPSLCWSQTPKTSGAAPQAAAAVLGQQPDANRTRDELSNLLEHYPPALRSVLALDPSLLANDSYLAPYPGLVNFVGAHPEVMRDPSFFLGEGPRPHFPIDPAAQELDLWRDVLGGIAVFIGIGMAIGLVIWLIRTFVDYRRWSRLSKVQTEVHTKLLDRFTANDDLLAYIQSPSGSKFLESSPIALDAAPRSLGAPLGRILWSVQGGIVLIAGGIGLYLVSARITDHASQPLHALGVLAVALGIGFILSAIISFAISYRLGLIERTAPTVRTELPLA
jgi:hypothetical protein